MVALNDDSFLVVFYLGADLHEKTFGSLDNGDMNIIEAEKEYSMINNRIKSQEKGESNSVKVDIDLKSEDLICSDIGFRDNNEFDKEGLSLSTTQAWCIQVQLSAPTELHTIKVSLNLPKNMISYPADHSFPRLSSNDTENMEFYVYLKNDSDPLQREISIDCCFNIRVSKFFFSNNQKIQRKVDSQQLSIIYRLIFKLNYVKLQRKINIKSHWNHQQ